MKKMYNNPKTEIMDVMPMSIICDSGEFGGDTNDPITGQAPARHGDLIP